MNKAKSKFVLSKNTHVLAQPIDFQALEEECKKAQTRYRKEEQLKAEQRYFEQSLEVASNRMVTDGTCPCGKHKGILFYQNDVQVSKESWCPVCVYLMWLRKAMREGRASQFVQETPFSGFIANFSLS